jgi:hypothetical protein
MFGPVIVWEIWRCKNFRVYSQDLDFTHFLTLLPILVSLSRHQRILRLNPQQKHQVLFTSPKFHMLQVEFNLKSFVSFSLSFHHITSPSLLIFHFSGWFKGHFIRYLLLMHCWQAWACLHIFHSISLLYKAAGVWPQGWETCEFKFIFQFFIQYNPSHASHPLFCTCQLLRLFISIISLLYL